MALSRPEKAAFDQCVRDVEDASMGPFCVRLETSGPVRTAEDFYRLTAENREDLLEYRLLEAVVAVQDAMDEKGFHPYEFDFLAYYPDIEQRPDQGGEVEVDLMHAHEIMS